MKKFRGYNLDSANELADKFENITGTDLNENSREADKASFRALFYKVLKDINGMNDRMISSWFANRGVTRNRSSIFQALRKTDIYYDNFVQFRNVYDIFFDDKKRVREKLESKRLEKLRLINERIAKKEALGERNKIHELADIIPADRIDEVAEIISLRIKSWEWKYRDRCQIIEASTSMDGMYW